jgi:peroxiredoxin
MTPLEVGQTGPDFKLASTAGGEAVLSEILKRHRATAILFYVLDFTPG